MNVFHILIVEDHEDWQTILEDYTREAVEGINHIDYMIRTYEAFNTSYKALDEQPWDLVVTDIALGGSFESHQKLGLEIVRKASGKNIPVIAVSGTPIVNTTEVRNLLKEHGASDYFSKSKFDAQRFVTKIQDLLFISQTTDEINRKLHEFQERLQMSSLEAQQKVAHDLVVQAQGDSEFRTKLIKWMKTIGDAATKTSVNEIVKKILILVLTSFH
ncbi:response regulator [Leptolyngbyaceae cyanobacterium CCMR0082]|uniref:Response regulator n=1 Tax=Adonisia turfae CCMR0082 TaxID=2304604 RepID=A0A6M0S568_9CYAN|nr:response regulator [Adonisia turfae]NEZ63002.1 response regulator [Adonisia turfae CCMR0082]